MTARLVVASHNAHKIRELRAMLASFPGVQVEGLDAYRDAPVVEETADTFVGNAELKAKGIADWLIGQGHDGGDLYVLADDSGICVDALDGAPGVYSARFAGDHATDATNNQRLVRELQARGLQESPGHYVCVLALATAGSDAMERFEGRWDVTVRVEGRGSGGFGYDPHAWLGDRTVAELAPDEKAAQSHRGQALRALARWWAEQGPGGR